MRTAGYGVTVQALLAMACVNIVGVGGRFSRSGWVAGITSGAGVQRSLPLEDICCMKAAPYFATYRVKYIVSSPNFSRLNSL